MRLTCMVSGVSVTALNPWHGSCRRRGKNDYLNVTVGLEIRVTSASPLDLTWRGAWVYYLRGGNRVALLSGNK